MAERRGESSEVKQCLSDPPEHAVHFLEVLCKSTGKVRRFAAGTDAGFALNLINKKINGGELPLASHIEAFKEGEEEVSFGPNSVLVDYGLGWKLQSVIELEGSNEKPEGRPARKRRNSSETVEDETRFGNKVLQQQQRPIISLVYIGKILTAFLLMFVLGAIFTLALENLPRFILYINSSMF